MELTSPDKERCQAEKPNGNTFMTLGGSPRLERCKNKPILIAIEVEPGKDGKRGSMSLCLECQLQLLKQLPPGYATFEKIEGE